jgi:hypothetical protein
VSASEGKAARTLRRLSPEVRRDLLRVLTSPPEVRGDVIRQFHERPDSKDMAEVLMDLEADELARFQVILLLQRSLGLEAG